MTYTEFKQEWLGKSIDYDHVYAKQCVDLILEYIKECYGLASGVWGNAIDYWNHPSAPLLTQFDKVQTTDCHPGDIVVLNGLAGNPYGHIGICDHQDANNVWLLEQNGATGNGGGVGNDAIGVWRSVPKSRIAGILRPKSLGSGPIQAPVPARSTVFLPSQAGPWHLYNIGSSLNPNDVRAVRAILRPDAFPPGLTYKIEAWVGDYAVVITTQMFGRGVVWVKGTLARIS